MTRRINLGDRGRDVLTGIDGVVYAITSYMTGCDYIGLKRPGATADGKAFDLHWADESAIELVAGEAVTLPGDTDNGNNGGPPLHSFGRN